MSRFFKIFDRSFQKLKNPFPVLTNFRNIWCKPGCQFEDEEAVCQVDCFCDPRKPKAVAVLRCKCLGIIAIFEKFIEERQLGEELEEEGLDQGVEEGLDEGVEVIPEKKHDTVLLELETVVYSFDWLFANYRDRCDIRVLSDSLQAVNWLTLKNPKPQPSYRPFIGKFIRTQGAFGMGAILDPVSREHTMDADLVGRFGLDCFLGVLIAQKALNQYSGGIEQYLSSTKADVFVCDGEYYLGPNFTFDADVNDRTSVVVIFQKALPLIEPDNFEPARSFPPLVLFDYLLKEVKLTRFMKNVQAVDLFPITKLLVIGEKKVLKAFSFEGDRPFCLLSLRKSCIHYAEMKFLGRDVRVVLSPEEIERRFCIAKDYYAKNGHAEDFYDKNDRLLIFSGRALRESSRPYLPAGDCLFVAVLG